MRCRISREIGDRSSRAPQTQQSRRDGIRNRKNVGFGRQRRRRRLSLLRRSARELRRTRGCIDRRQEDVRTSQEEQRGGCRGEPIKEDGRPCHRLLLPSGDPQSGFGVLGISLPDRFGNNPSSDNCAAAFRKRSHLGVIRLRVGFRKQIEDAPMRAFLEYSETDIPSREENPACSLFSFASSRFGSVEAAGGWSALI